MKKVTNKIIYIMLACFFLFSFSGVSANATTYSKIAPKETPIKMVEANKNPYYMYFTVDKKMMDKTIKNRTILIDSYRNRYDFEMQYIKQNKLLKLSTNTIRPNERVGVISTSYKISKLDKIDKIYNFYNIYIETGIQPEVNQGISFNSINVKFVINGQQIDTMSPIIENALPESANYQITTSNSSSIGASVGNTGVSINGTIGKTTTKTTDVFTVQKIAKDPFTAEWKINSNGMKIENNQIVTSRHKITIKVPKKSKQDINATVYVTGKFWGHLSKYTRTTSDVIAINVARTKAIAVNSYVSKIKNGVEDTCKTFGFNSSLVKLVQYAETITTNKTNSRVETIFSWF